MDPTLVESKTSLSEEDSLKAEELLNEDGYWLEGHKIASVDIDSPDIVPRRVVIHFKDKNNKHYSRMLTYKFWLNPEKKVKKVKEDEFIMPKTTRRK